MVNLPGVVNFGDTGYPHTIWITFPSFQSLFQEPVFEETGRRIQVIDGVIYDVSRGGGGIETLPFSDLTTILPDIPDLEKHLVQRAYPIPVAPEKIAFTEQQTSKTYSVISLGEINIPGRRKLRQVAWESHFPRVYDHSIEEISIRNHINPRSWVELIRATQSAGLTVRVSIDNTPIDITATISSFKGGYVPGPTGDVWYQIALNEYREGRVREFDGVRFPEINSRGRPGGQLPEFYTVVANDTLQDISWKLYGTIDKWEEIYSLNKKKIRSLFSTVPEVHDNIADDDPEDRADLSEDVRPVNEFDPITILWSVSDPLPEGLVLRVPKISVVR